MPLSSHRHPNTRDLTSTMSWCFSDDVLHYISSCWICYHICNLLTQSAKQNTNTTASLNKQSSSYLKMSSSLATKTKVGKSHISQYPTHILSNNIFINENTIFIFKMKISLILCGRSPVLSIKYICHSKFTIPMCLKLSNTEKMLRAQVISQQNTQTKNQNIVTMCHI